MSPAMPVADAQVPMDTAISALVTDLKERSMIKDVVIVWMGEFGRTPRIITDQLAAQ